LQLVLQPRQVVAKQVAKQMATATVNLWLDTRKTPIGTGIVKWSVISERTPRLFTTSCKTTLSDWEFLQANKGKLDNRIKDENKIRLWHKFYGVTFEQDGQLQTSILRRAQAVISQLGNTFTFDAFAEGIANYGKTKATPTDQTDVIAALENKAAIMKKADRIGNADLFGLAAKSLKRFVSSFGDGERKEFLNIPIPRRKANEQHLVPTLRFEHITPNFLTTYEHWMLHYGKTSRNKDNPDHGSPASLTTTGIYLRHLRAIINDAIEAGLVSRDAYPFGRSKYVIAAGNNPKKALSKTDLGKIKSYQPLLGSMEQRSHDIWLFTYYCNGINLTDICHLTWSQVDLKEGKLTFIRQKTSRSRKQNQTQIVAYLRPETMAVIDRWATHDRIHSDYVFPFLTSGMDATRRKDIVKQITLITNRWMRKIAASLNIEADITTYSARHSYATNLLKSKAPIAFISKSLGHNNIKTTESYLGSFDDDEAKEFLSAL
jgi:integrase